MKFKILLFLFFIAGEIGAQNTHIVPDTIMQGYYPAPDSGWQSFRVTIRRIAGVANDREVLGNVLPPDIILMIIFLKPGSMVTYDHIVTTNGQTNGRVAAHNYIIGPVNTVDAVDCRGETIFISAESLANIVLDSTVLAFAVSVSDGKYATEFGVDGNRIPENRKPFIRSLAAGQKVYFEMILVDDGGGKQHRIPLRTYVIAD